MGYGPYTDLGRPPLREGPLRRALVVPDGLWSDLRVVGETGSTNADVVAAARAGAPEGLVLVAERQIAGRGRLGRQWESPARAGIAVSVLLRPAGDRTGAGPAPRARYGWLPLLAGVALVNAVRRVSDVDAILKWPNDMLVRHGDSQRKCAGILVEAVPGGAGEPALVVGIGLNTTAREPELPSADATSLALAGAACADRDPLLRAILRGLSTWYLNWRAVAGDAETCGLREAYAFHCGTLGQQVRVELPGGAQLTGRASGVDADGRLVVRDVDGGTHLIAAGDVVHLR